MAASAAHQAPDGHVLTGGGTRQRLLDVALRLFAEWSFAGTSLQMIADELGFTKAAVYHHFRTREELLRALAAPGLDELWAVVEAAETRRTPRARAEHALAGFVDVAVRHRRLIAILGTDRAVVRSLKGDRRFDELLARQIRLLGGAQPDPAGRINAVVALSGIASSVGGDPLHDLDDATMRSHLLGAGRRVLGLRAPRGTRAARSEHPS